MAAEGDIVKFIQPWHIYTGLYAIFWLINYYFDCFIMTIITCVIGGFSSQFLAPLIPGGIETSYVPGAKKEAPKVKEESQDYFYDKPLPPEPPREETPEMEIAPPLENEKSVFQSEAVPAVQESTPEVRDDPIGAEDRHSSSDEDLVQVQRTEESFAQPKIQEDESREDELKFEEPKPVEDVVKKPDYEEPLLQQENQNQVFNQPKFDDEPLFKVEEENQSFEQPKAHAGEASEPSILAEEKFKSYEQPKFDAEPLIQAEEKVEQLQQPKLDSQPILGEEQAKINEPLIEAEKNTDSFKEPKFDSGDMKMDEKLDIEPVVQLSESVAATPNLETERSRSPTDGKFIQEDEQRGVSPTVSDHGKDQEQKLDNFETPAVTKEEEKRQDSPVMMQKEVEETFQQSTTAESLESARKSPEFGEEVDYNKPAPGEPTITATFIDSKYEEEEVKEHEAKLELSAPSADVRDIGNAEAIMDKVEAVDKEVREKEPEKDDIEKPKDLSDSEDEGREKADPMKDSSSSSSSEGPEVVNYEDDPFGLNPKKTEGGTTTSSSGESPDSDQAKDDFVKLGEENLLDVAKTVGEETRKVSIGDFVDQERREEDAAVAADLLDTKTSPDFHSDKPASTPDVGDLLNPVADMIPTVHESSKDKEGLLDNIMDKGSDSLGDLMDKGRDALDNLMDKGRDSLDNIMSSSETAPKEGSNFLITEVQGATDSVADLLQDAQKEIASTATSTQQAIEPEKSKDDTNTLLHSPSLEDDMDPLQAEKESYKKKFENDDGLQTKNSSVSSSGFLATTGSGEDSSLLVGGGDDISHRAVFGDDEEQDENELLDEFSINKSVDSGSGSISDSILKKVDEGVNELVGAANITKKEESPSSEIIGEKIGCAESVMMNEYFVFMPVLGMSVWWAR